MRNALLTAFGGPMGRYARHEGKWFDPLRWSLITGVGLFVVLALRQVPCVQTSSEDKVNAFIRLCYSDIAVAWTSQHFGDGVPPLGSDPMLHPPLLGLVLLGAMLLTTLLRPGDPGLERSSSQAIDLQLMQAQLFFAVMIVVLFISFLVVVVCVSYLGRGSRGGREPTWDGTLIALSPVVLASGLISYDLLAIALVALGLLHLVREQFPLAGILLGLAVGVSLLALPVLLAVVFTVALHGRHAQLRRLGIPAALTVAAINLPLLVWSPTTLLGFYRAEMSQQTGYGSLWFAGRMFGLEVRSAGSLGFMLTCLALVCLVLWILLRGLRPRLQVVIVLFLYPTVLLAPAVGPQTGLWLLFALVLARPLRRELVAFTVTQVLYWAAVWGYLAGSLSNNPNLYFLTLLFRVAVEVWILISCLREAAREPGVPVEEPPGAAQECTVRDDDPHVSVAVEESGR